MATFSETMPRQKVAAEQILVKLREAKVLSAPGRPVAEAARPIGVSEQACVTSFWIVKSSTASRKSA